MQKNKRNNAQVTAQQFKDVLANFASGITLVTTLNAQGEPAGLLVSSLSSVSLDPPLILFCLAKRSQLHDVFAMSESFTVNMLNTDQKYLVDQFTAHVEDRWAVVDYTIISGAPITVGNLATIECSVSARHDAGDHTIYVGQAMSLTQGEGAPLLYHNRLFGGFSAIA